MTTPSLDAAARRVGVVLARRRGFLKTHAEIADCECDECQVYRAAREELERAVAEEREACADLCDRWERGLLQGRELARLIRARGSR